MSQESINILSTSVHNVNAALQKQDFDIVIEQTTRGLNQLHQIHFHLLSARIIAYEQKNELDQAYSDSTIMTNEFPNSALGYIHTTNILMKRRKSEQAFTTCNNALEQELVAPSDPNYEDLMQLYRSVIDRRKQKEKIDFMKILPKEIVSIIVEYLRMGERLICLNVSQRWRQTILDCPNALCSWILGPFSAQRDLRVGYENVQLISEYLRELHIFLLESDQEAFKAVVNMLDNVKFDHLRTFSLYASSIDRVRLWKVLDNSKYTLEELYFTFASTRISFVDIISRCKNIKNLTFDTTRPLGYSNNPPLPLSLTHLKIHAEQIGKMELQAVLETGKNLQELTIGYCHAGLLMTFTRWGSKSLYHIVLNPNRFDPADTIPEYQRALKEQEVKKVNSMTKKYITSGKMIGVHDCDDVTAQLLLPLLKKYEHTTEAISVAVSQEGDEGPHYWREFTGYGTPLIKFLKLGITDKTEPIFASVIRNCPALEVIEFCESRLTDITFDALQSISSREEETGGLRCFVIRGDEDGPKTRVSDKGLRSFFEFYASLGKKSTLEEVRLEFISGIQAFTLRTLSQIKSLKHINLAGTLEENEEVMNIAIRSFSNSSSLPLLEYVSFDQIPITDEGIEQIDCKHIKLHGLDDITTAGVEAMINNSNVLKYLEVAGCQDVEYEPVLNLTKISGIKLSFTV
ncbi:hypothetical protein INT45_000574 [Circinella minor]|uniref:F-box domain-containing protein n=1 Tax=Circinella minor TaxID=1195481 RepID=A0A8H7SC29_9FUNG|nr:hypothetical protein INT45_000574 [Circinella minor]